MRRYFIWTIFEDINNSADGGLYAELVNNRSFEAFEYNTYDAFSGVDGKSTGRNHTPLKYWFGDLYKVSLTSTVSRPVCIVIVYGVVIFGTTFT